MLERWDAGTEEPPHSHPGDDMTIVVEGRMSTQRYRREGDVLVPDGEAVILNKGDVGYTRAHRIHDAKYLDNCELVYVHNGAFAFNREEGDVESLSHWVLASVVGERVAGEEVETDEEPKDDQEYSSGDVLRAQRRGSSE